MKHTQSNSDRGFSMLPLIFLFIAMVPVLFATVAGEIWRNTHQPRDTAQLSLEKRMTSIADELTAALGRARQSSFNVRGWTLSELGDSEMTPWFVPYEDDDTGYEQVRFSTPRSSGAEAEYGNDIDYVIRFTRDEHEALNGVDDDGDGAVDEGRVEIRSGNGEFRVLAGDVKTCEFTIRGWEVHFVIEAERLFGGGRFAYTRITRAVPIRYL